MGTPQESPTKHKLSAPNLWHCKCIFGLGVMRVTVAAVVHASRGRARNHRLGFFDLPRLGAAGRRQK